ncbi:MAG: NAD kinase, partial [Hyphomicrobiales bacterium]|nr:NAD kinase [Hyphomicrobiales bacterium]
IRITILEAEKRPVSTTADNVEFRFITEVDITEDRASACLMLFDPDHSLDERILAEQFGY